MSSLLVGLLSVLAATNQAEAASNLVQKTTGASVEFVNRNDPVEMEYQELLATDDRAQEEMDKWIRDAQAFAEQGAPHSQATLQARIKDRLAELKKSYQAFLEKHPNHVKARLAYGSFLNDTREETLAEIEWEKARQLDPKNPATWNNLANHYGHFGNVRKSFDYYAKAIELNPKEPVYYQNFATTVYLFRKDAMEHYQINEQQVFDKALDLYRKAVALAPKDFLLYSDYAQSFYGTKPPRYEDGLKAWQEAALIARDDVERQGALVHIIRIKINLGQLEAARQDMANLTNPMYAELKGKFQAKLDGKEKPAEPAAAPATAAPPEKK